MGNKNQERLLKRIAELEAQVKSLEQNLIHDRLTGLKTRAFFEEEIETHLNVLIRSERRERKEYFGIIFFDIDHFKNINDTYGHDVGDVVLQKTSETIESSLRTGDIAARWGGEELIVALIGASEKDVLAKAEEIRIKVESLTFPEVPNLKFTISGGIASSEKGMTLAQLVKRADQALYIAKSVGRNKIIVYGNQG